MPRGEDHHHLTWPQALAELDALRAEVTVLRRRVAELTADRDVWRSRREGNW